MQPANSAKLLLLIHQIPTKPDYLRVKVGRELQRLGAVAIKSSVYVAPATPAMRKALAGIARGIHQRGGEAVVCDAQFVDGLTDGAVEDLFRGARDSEYSAVAKEAKGIAIGMRGGRAADDARRRPAARRLERLRLRFDEIALRDSFGARGREAAARILSLAEDQLEGVDLRAKRVAGRPEPPRGATWVTRTGIMVDRIASAWLIRRFIDPDAAFRFVTARGDRLGRDEIPFDMAGAEFTHRNGNCTFEVLVEHFRLRASGLSPIAEIVHDLDFGGRQVPSPGGRGCGSDDLGAGNRQAERSRAPRLERRNVREPLRIISEESVMKWVTRENVHVDRVACPWLIRKFVDPKAEFLFVPADQVMAVAERERATPYDVKGVELGHHGKECSFDAIVKKHGLTSDPALVLLARIVNGADTDNSLWNQPESAGLKAVAEGFRSLGFKDDHALNAAEWIVYDALYAYCQQMTRERKAEGVSR